MSKFTEQDLIPVPRNRVFVLNDGMFVVQWEENRVQSLMDGRYIQYNSDRFGNAITEYELNQLKNTGVVAHYDEELIFLAPMTNPTQHTRAYYLNTTLPKSQFEQVKNALDHSEFGDRFSVRLQEIFVIIRARSGTAFSTFDEAERARELFQEQFPELLNECVVAFVEVDTVS